MACADTDASAAQRAAQATSGVQHACVCRVVVGIGSTLDRCGVDRHTARRARPQLARRHPRGQTRDDRKADGDERGRGIRGGAGGFQSRITCMVGYSLRFSTGKYVHDFLEAGHVGDVRAVSGSIGLPPMNRGWMSTTEHGGGPLLYVGCHVVDFVLWFTGAEPVSVFAMFAVAQSTGTDELTAIQLRLANGVVAQCWCRKPSQRSATTCGCTEPLATSACADATCSRRSWKYSVLRRGHSVTRQSSVPSCAAMPLPRCSCQSSTNLRSRFRERSSRHHRGRRSAGAAGPGRGGGVRTSWTTSRNSGGGPRPQLKGARPVYVRRWSVSIVVGRGSQNPFVH